MLRWGRVVPTLQGAHQEPLLLVSSNIFCRPQNFMAYFVSSGVLENLSYSVLWSPISLVFLTKLVASFYFGVLNETCGTLFLLMFSTKLVAFSTTWD